MFEAKLNAASLLKKLMDAIKDIVTDVPFDCTDTGMSIQVGLKLCFYVTNCML